jgi:hypothetical protein
MTTGRAGPYAGGFHILRELHQLAGRNRLTQTDPLTIPFN